MRAVKGRQSIVQLRLGGRDVLGQGFNIRPSEDDCDKLVVSEVLPSASDVLRSLMNAGSHYTAGCSWQLCSPRDPSLGLEAPQVLSWS